MKQHSLKLSAFKLFNRLASVTAIAASVTNGSGLEATESAAASGSWLFQGRLNTWSLYQLDDFDSTTVALVYDASDNLLGVAVGPDIPTECAAPRRCEFRKIGTGEGNGSELELGRTINSSDPTGSETITKGELGGDTLLSNIGADIRGVSGPLNFRINGNFTANLMENRALYGSQKYRPRFSDTYFEYKGADYLYSIGRRSLTGPATVDGVYGEKFFGPSSSPDAKAAGFFLGLAPDPISKYPSKDYLTVGPTYRFIPNFASQGDTKLYADGSLVAEMYKGDMSRFYLYNKVHFTPVRQVSFLALSTLELPWPPAKEDNGFSSSHFSLQTFWRPQSQWFASFGFSQFRISRFLDQTAVRWVTDDGSTQSLRVSDSLDKSHRYRFDVGLSYRPILEAQPFVRFRYERRTIDSNKTADNTPVTPAADFTPSKNLSVLNRKDAHRTSLGLRLFLLGGQLETESTATYTQRFKSQGYDFYQTVAYDWGTQWAFDAYFQYVSSKRDIDSAVLNQTAPSYRDKSTDFYAGAGTSYRFLSNLIGQFRYDFSHEHDYALDTDILSHTLLGRLDYNF